MKIAILISKNAQYRLLSPVIEAALARGWEVECWHDQSQPSLGLKAYLFPSEDSVPIFQTGKPTVKTYHGAAELRVWLAQMRADVAIATGLATFDLPLSERRPLIVCQQQFIDSLAWDGPEGVKVWDLLALYSRWWLDWSAALFKSEGKLIHTEPFLADMASRSAFVGFPELDAASQVDPREVRKRWGIDAERPVVVLFPFPQGVGRDTFWPKRICAEPSRLMQLAHMLAQRRFEYWPHIRHGWNDANVVRALRRFCDRNGAYLLVKSRRKTPVPAYLAAVADRCVDDEQLYPATIIDVLSIASLSVSYYSNSVFESVSLGVPHLCVTYSAVDYNGSDSTYFSTFYTATEGSPFQFEGASSAWTIAETLERLPGRSLAEFHMSPDARARYLQKFLTHDAGNAGARTMDAIEAALNQTGRARSAVSA